EITAEPLAGGRAPAPGAASLLPALAGAPARSSGPRRPPQEPRASIPRRAGRAPARSPRPLRGRCVPARDPHRRAEAAQRGPGGAAHGRCRARRVVIVTGFCVPPGIPETDGPPGAAVLGRALDRLGAHVRYVTDASVRGSLAAALSALGEPPDVDVYHPGS